MEKSRVWTGFFVMLGLVFLGAMLPVSVSKLKSFDRTVTVKGLCEKEVKADKVMDFTREIKTAVLDDVLEIIDRLDTEAVEDFELDTDYGLAVVHDRFAKARKKIEALKGGEQE